MLTRSELEAYVAAKGPYLYHRAPAEALPLIAQQGVLPWDHEERRDVEDYDDEGRTTSYADSRMTPRSDHAYVGSLGYVRRYAGVTLRVDLRELDPLALAGDEDHFDLSRYHVPEEFASRLETPPREWGSWADYVDPDCADCEGAGGDCLACDGSGKDYEADVRDEETLGDWAERQRTVIDSPEAVRYSLEQGSLAVKGGIPSSALSVDPDRLAPAELEQVARAFSDVALTVQPFAVEHEGQEFVVRPDPEGDFELPAGWPTWKVQGYVQQARGAKVLELLNGGALSELGVPPAPQLRPELQPAGPTVGLGL